jgi:hypothetical protein
VEGKARLSLLRRGRVRSRAAMAALTAHAQLDQGVLIEPLARIRNRNL